MRVDYEWLDMAIDTVTKGIVPKVVNPSRTATVENNNGEITIKIKGDMK